MEPATSHVLVASLDVEDDQHGALLRTMRVFNAACNRAAKMAFDQHTADKSRVQRELYREFRDQLGLPAALAINAISRACEAYKLNKDVLPQFSDYAAVPYDWRTVAWKRVDKASILTLGGRELVPVHFEGYEDIESEMWPGQAELVYRGGAFKLIVTVELTRVREGMIDKRIATSARPCSLIGAPGPAGLGPATLLPDNPDLLESGKTRWHDILDKKEEGGA